MSDEMTNGWETTTPSIDDERATQEVRSTEIQIPKVEEWQSVKFNKY